MAPSESAVDESVGVVAVPLVLVSSPDDAADSVVVVVAVVVYVSGTLGNGDGAERPVYVVILETLWTESTDVRSLPAEMVYEIAKHDCSIWYYPPDHQLDGDIWITDHFAQEITDTNGDRCSECGSTYFKIRDGEPECGRCGTGESTVQTKLGVVE